MSAQLQKWRDSICDLRDAIERGTNSRKDTISHTFRERAVGLSTPSWQSTNVDAISPVNFSIDSPSRAAEVEDPPRCALTNAIDTVTQSRKRSGPVD